MTKKEDFKMKSKLKELPIKKTIFILLSAIALICIFQAVQITAIRIVDSINGIETYNK